MKYNTPAACRERKVELKRSSLHILKAYVTLEIVKHDKCPKREWASAYY
jgi:hypothetical protein